MVHFELLPLAEEKQKEVSVRRCLYVRIVMELKIPEDICSTAIGEIFGTYISPNSRN